VRKFLELFPERVAYIQNVAQTVRVSKRQCPQLYVLFQEACSILDVPEPELYVAQSPIANAMTSGHTHPYIIVTTGLLDLMNEDEQLAVVAHELGHIKSGHVLYRTMAMGISLLLSVVGDMTLGIGRLVGRSLEGALLEWSRKSEFTADRAALLAVQDPQVMLTLMMKFAGGTLFQRHQMNAEEFLKQADLYEEVDTNMLDRIYKMMLVASVSHPLTIVRAREIMNWSDSQVYTDALEGRYPRMRESAGNYTGARSNGSTPKSSSNPTLIRCPHCGHDQTNRRFCSLCGGAIS